MSYATKLQQLLAANGLYAGQIDGKIGPMTLAGVERAIVSAKSTGGGAPAPVAEFDENTQLLIKELERDEGRVLHAYPDSLGYLTIGIGRLIDKRKRGGISNEEADYLKANDIRRIQAALDAKYPEWRKLSPVRQRAMQNMAFQLGVNWPDEWRNTYAMIRAGNFSGAAAAMRGSLWRSQTPARADRVIAQWEKG